MKERREKKRGIVHREQETLPSPHLANLAGTERWCNDIYRSISIPVTALPLGLYRELSMWLSYEFGQHELKSVEY